MIISSSLLRSIQTGELKKPEDIPEGDFRRVLPRFQGEAFYQNLKLVDQLKEIAEHKGATPAQIAIAWIRHISAQPGMPVIIPIPGASSDKRVRENTKEVTLTN